jgi:hypothetical protein
VHDPSSQLQVEALGGDIGAEEDPRSAARFWAGWSSRTEPAEYIFALHRDVADSGALTGTPPWSKVGETLSQVPHSLPVGREHQRHDSIGHQRFEVRSFPIELWRDNVG